MPVCPHAPNKHVQVNTDANSNIKADIHSYDHTRTQIDTQKRNSFTRDSEISYSYLSCVHGGLCSCQFICNEDRKMSTHTPQCKQTSCKNNTLSARPLNVITKSNDPVFHRCTHILKTASLKKSLC